MQNKAPSEYSVTLGYLRGKPSGGSHHSKKVKKSRVSGKDPWTKAGADYCARCGESEWNALGCYNNNPNFNALMSDKGGAGAGNRRFYCLGSKGAVDPNMKFFDKDNSDKIVWKDAVVCPDAKSSRFNTSNNDLICKWESDKVNTALLKKLKRLSNTSSVAAEVYDKLKVQFCNVVENLNKNIDDTQTCLSADKEQKKLTAYCAIGNKIKPDGDALCQPSAAAGDGKLSDTAWNKIAEDYCKKNKNDSWCACYNVREGICQNKNTKAAGCKQHYEKLAALEGAIDPKTYALMTAKKPKECLSDVCMGTPNTIFKIRGDPSPPDCSDNLNICNNIVSAGVAKNSPITANCDMTSIVQKEAPSSGSSSAPSSGSSSAPSSGSDEDDVTSPENVKKVLDVVNRKKAEEAEEAEGDSDSKGGPSPGMIAGISVAVLLCCLLVVAVMMMG